MRRFAPVLLLPLIAGCATILPRGQANLNPAGQTLQVIAANGAESRMQFRPNGEVVAAFGERSIIGTWEREGGDLCFQWGNAARECWPYSRPFERGETITVTSSRGNVVRVTRI
ncbi:MAG TPA: hypothetical protein VGB54_00055 [Allosphingosinicella sp.]|jgi:hypothetical protein